MISYVKGVLEYRDETGIVLDNHGIGYHVMVPQSVLDQLPHKGSELKIYTYMNVREDALQLYGFLTPDDLDMFQKLIRVNGIGPKGALAILSILTPDDLRFAILSEDAKAIAKAPGIGAKTASKCILELKDKVDLQEAFEKKSCNSTIQSDAKAEAIQALVALGYSQSDAMKGLGNIEITADMSVEDILKAGLKKM